MAIKQVNQDSPASGKETQVEDFFERLQFDSNGDIANEHELGQNERELIDSIRNRPQQNYENPEILRDDIERETMRGYRKQLSLRERLEAQLIADRNQRERIERERQEEAARQESNQAFATQAASESSYVATTARSSRSERFGFDAEEARVASPVEADTRRAAHVENSPGVIDNPDARQTNKTPKVEDIEGYTAKPREDLKAVEYYEKEQQRLAFVDEGHRVRVSNADKNKDNIRAALELASRKFQRITVNGTEEFREEIARQAAAMGLKDRLASEELRQKAEQFERELQEQMRVEHQKAVAQEDDLVIRTSQEHAQAQTMNQGGDELEVKSMQSKAARQAQAAGDDTQEDGLEVRSMQPKAVQQQAAQASNAEEELVVASSNTIERSEDQEQVQGSGGRRH